MKTMDELLQFRDQLDVLDKELLTLITKRIEIVKQVGEYKKRVGKPVVDPVREKQKIESLISINQSTDISPEMIEKLWRTFFEIAYEIEK